MIEPFEMIIRDFTHIRWLGCKNGIEANTKMWNEIIVNRTGELEEWGKLVRSVHKRKIKVFAFANNHYAGYGPATVEQFRMMLGKIG